MQVDSRAFFTLTSPSGKTCQCLKPKRTRNGPQFSGNPGSNRPLNEGETFSIQAFAPIPDDVVENALITVDNIKYRVRKFGVEYTRSGAKISVSDLQTPLVQRDP